MQVAPWCPWDTSACDPIFMRQENEKKTEKSENNSKALGGAHLFENVCREPWLGSDYSEETHGRVALVKWECR